MNNETKILTYVLRMLEERRYIELKVFAQIFAGLAERLPYSYQFDEVLNAYFDNSAGDTPADDKKEEENETC